MRSTLAIAILVITNVILGVLLVRAQKRSSYYQELSTVLLENARISNKISSTKALIDAYTSHLEQIELLMPDEEDN